MFHVVLYQPQIPPNTGNIIRLCANTGCQLHLIQPLGFELDDRRLRRAGLDYHEWIHIRQHPSLDAFIGAVGPTTLYACSTRGSHHYAQTRYRAGDALVFGPETRGLPGAWLARLPPGQVLRIPMVPGQRSLNLANAVAVMVFEAWRQQGFSGGA